MSKVQVDKVVNLSDDGAPQLTYGAELPVGYGLTGAGGLNITGVVTAASAVFSGNVTIGGTLTYEDVTNIDVVGVSTFAGRMNVNSTIEANEGINVSAGVGTFAGNVSIADKIIHTGDTNTAIRFPAADTISAETGGSERLRINSDGDVLIATTTTPSADIKLLVSGNGGVSSGSYFSFRGDYGNVSEPAAHAIKFDSTISASGGLHLYSYGGTQFDLGGQPRINFTQAGSVGVGTTNPDQTLEIHTLSGTNLFKASTKANSTVGLEIEKTGATTQTWRIADGQSANGKLEFYDVTDSRSVMTFDGAGKVGVGTLSPGMQFHINGSATNDILKLTANGSGQMVNMQNHSNVPAIVRFSNYLGNAFWDAQYNTDNSFSLDHSDSEKFRITSAGTVGINESSPDANFKLHVDGMGKFTNNLAMNDGKMIYWGDSDTSFILGYDAAAGGYLAFGSNNERMRLLNTGHLGIGITNPSQRLVVQAGSDNSDVAVLTGGDQTRGLKISTAASGNNDAKVIFDAQNADNGCFSFKTHGDERLSIGSDGDTTITHDTTTKLVSNGTTCNLRLQTSNTGATTGDGLAIQVDSSSNAYFHNYENGDMYFGTNNTTKAVFGKNREIKFTNSTITERMHYDSGAGMQNDYNHDTMSYGMVWYGASNAVGTWTFNIRGDGSTAFNDLIDNGTTTTMTMIAGNNSTSYYMTAFKIDGTTQTVEWAGGSAPSAGTGSGYDSYVITIFKSSSNTYKCFGNFTNFN